MSYYSPGEPIRYEVGHAHFKLSGGAKRSRKHCIVIFCHTFGVLVPSEPQRDQHHEGGTVTEPTTLAPSVGTARMCASARADDRNQEK